jgi:hypothetical protein
VPLKSVIDIDINDAKFQRFKDLFDSFAARAEKQPALWTKVTDAQRQMGTTFENAIEHLDTSNEQLQRSETLWSRISHSSDSLLHNVLGVSSGLVKWATTLTAIGAGILGGGFFGIDKMAASAARDRRTTLGFGSLGGPGPLRAFGIDMGRLLDTDAFLSGVNEMETDVGQQGPAFSLLHRRLSGDTTSDAVAMLKATRELALKTPTNLLGPLFQSYGLNYSADELRRLKTMPGPEFQTMLGQFGKDSKDLNFSDKIAKTWTDFIANTERAGAAINKTFAVKLAPLEPNLEKLTNSFVKAIEAFAGSHLIKDAIDLLGKSLGRLSDALLGFNSFMDKYDALNETFKDMDSSAWDYWREKAKGFLGIGQQDARQDYGKYLGSMDTAYNIGRGTLELIKRLEHSGQRSVSPAGARGFFQLMPDTAKQYGVDDPFDPAQAAVGAAKFLSHLESKYANDKASVLAAYNAGEGRVDALKRAHGKDWLDYAPAETQGYVIRGMAASGIHIFVHNSTGGDVNVSTLGLATAP